MCATALIPRPPAVVEDALSEVLTTAHDGWMADGDRYLGPVTYPEATFLERWAAVSYLRNQFPERFKLEQGLLGELHSFFTPELKEHLRMQVDRLMRLHRDLEQFTQRHGAAREIAHTARELLETLRLWYAEVEFAAGSIHREDLSTRATRFLDLFEGSARAQGLGFL